MLLINNSAFVQCDLDFADLSFASNAQLYLSIALSCLILEITRSMIVRWLCSFKLWVDDVRANQRDRVPLDDWQPRTKDWPAGNSIDDIKRAWVKCTHLRMALKTQPIRHACCLCGWLTYFTAELTLSLMASCPIVVELMTVYVVDQASV